MLLRLDRFGTRCALHGACSMTSVGPACLVPTVPLRAPELEAPSRGVEIRGEFAPNRFDIVPELEHLIVEKAVAVADVLVLP